MKYWLFDGNDVVGPFALGELAARPGFSATSLICAEDASEDAAGWQMASFFEAFRFNPITGRVEGVFPTEKQAGISQPAPVHEVVSSAATDLPPVQVRSFRPKPETAPQPTPAPQIVPQQPPADLITESNTNWVPPETIKKPVTQKKTQAAPKSEQLAPAVQTAPAKAPDTAPKKTQPTETKTPVVKETSAQKAVASKPRKKEDFSFVRLSRSKRLQAPPAPVALAQENVDLILPQLSEVDTPAEQPQEQIQTNVPEDEPVAPLQTAQPVSAKASPEPETEIISTCTLPIVNEILTQSDLPKLSESNFPPVALPAQPNFEWKKALDEENVSSVQSEVLSVLTSEGEPSLPASPEGGKTHESAEKSDSQDPVEDLTAELLNEPSHKKAHPILYTLLFVVIVGTFWFLGVPRLRALVQARVVVKPTPAPVAVQEAAPVEEPTPEPVVEEVATVAPVLAPKTVTAEDKALAVVQNYQLSDNRGTVASYFDRVYASHLAQGYTASWSVEPLHKNIYIVKYRLTKTRTEPIVYVFQADAVREQLTGALNNVALDLVGRI